MEFPVLAITTKEGVSIFDSYKKMELSIFSEVLCTAEEGAVTIGEGIDALVLAFNLFGVKYPGGTNGNVWRFAREIIYGFPPDDNKALTPGVMSMAATFGGPRVNPIAF